MTGGQCLVHCWDQYRLEGGIGGFLVLFLVIAVVVKIYSLVRFLSAV